MGTHSLVSNTHSEPSFIIKGRSPYLGGAKSVPGYFAGWKLEPGLIWKGVVKVFDHEAIRLGKPNAFFPIKVRQAEVIFRRSPTLPSPFTMPDKKL